MKIIERLFVLEDKEYAKLQVRLIPGIKSDSVIGVPIPECRNLAKLLYKSTDDDTVSEVQEFLKKLPHVYYDENILHGLNGYHKSVVLKTPIKKVNYDTIHKRIQRTGNFIV